MRKVLAILLTVCLLCGLTACGGGKSSGSVEGVYVATTVEMLGGELNLSDVYQGTNTIELQEGGKCVFTMEDDPTTGTWEVNGDEIVINVEGVDSVGTLKNGVITIDFMGMEMIMTFIKE